MGWVAPSVRLPTCILTDTDCLPPYFMLVQTIKCMIVICVLCVCHTLVGQCYELYELYELDCMGDKLHFTAIVDVQSGRLFVASTETSLLRSAV